MKRSILLVGIVWVAVILASTMKGLAESGEWIVASERIEFSTQAVALFSLVSFLFFFVMSFVRRSEIPTFGTMIVVWVLDRVFGDHSVSPFLRLSDCCASSCYSQRDYSFMD